MKTIRELRKEKGMTQEELGNRIGKPKQYISSLENGKRCIESIATVTSCKMAEILGTTVEELVNPPEDINDSEFEWEDGKLVVDNISYDTGLNRVIIENDGLYYAIKGKLSQEIPLKQQLIQVRRHCEFKDLGNTIYMINNCVPRQGFNIEVGREITPSEMQSIREEYNILDDDISDEFIEIKGDVFGDKYKKTYTCVQIKVAESIASELESKLNDKGIEAKNIAVGRVNIRTK